MLNELKNMVLDIDKLLGDTKSIDQILSAVLPFGNIRQAESYPIYGFNHDSSPSFSNGSSIHHGYVFFTRPQICLNDMNIAAGEAFFHPLATTNNKSIWRYIRCTLDPAQDVQFDVKSPLVNENTGFIPLMTNTLETLGGFPDITISNEVTPEGLRGEQQSLPDGHVDIFKVYDIACTFKIQADFALLRLLLIWQRYIAQVKIGKLAPYAVMTTEREIDYNTRIYRVLLDKYKKKVIGICASGPCYPQSVMIGSIFDYKRDQPINTDFKTISISFSAEGVRYFDPRTAYDFNNCSMIFEPELAKYRVGIPCNLEEVPANEDGFPFNYHCIPYIDEKTNDFKWLVNKQSNRYKKLKQYYRKREEMEEEGRQQVLQKPIELPAFGGIFV